MCLDSARYGIAWGAIGAAMDCYDSALRYSKKEFSLETHCKFSIGSKEIGGDDY